jgi:hypothetical protein
MSDFEQLPDDVRFEKQPGNWYKLFIDGKRVEIGCFATSKDAFKRYFLRKYGVNLRTEKRIKKNYKEFTIKKDSKNSNTYIKIFI